jgi:hypothetical protein
LLVLSFLALLQVPQVQYMCHKVIRMAILFRWFALQLGILQYTQVLLAQLPAGLRLLQQPSSHNAFLSGETLRALVKPVHIWRSALVLGVGGLQVFQLEAFYPLEYA